MCNACAGTNVICDDVDEGLPEQNSDYAYPEMSATNHVARTAADRRGARLRGVK